MHLPVATTHNRGLGLNPSVHRVKSSVVTEFDSGMSPRNVLKREKIQSTPQLLVSCSLALTEKSYHDSSTVISHGYPSY